MRVELKAQRIEFGSKTHGANDPHRVFPVTQRRVTDHADDLFPGIANAIVVVHNDLSLGIVVHRVDGEVAPRRVFLHRAPDVVTQHPARAVHGVLHAGQLALAGALVAADLLGQGAVQVGAKGRHLDHLMLTPPAINHMDDAKTPADDEGAAKQRLDLLGCCVGGDIEIFRPQANQEVAHRTTDDVGLKAGLLEDMNHIHRALVDQLDVDAMVLELDVMALAKWRFGNTLGGCWYAGGFSKQLVYEFFDHEI